MKLDSPMIRPGLSRTSMLLGSSLAFISPVLAAPPIWEPDFGSPIAALTAEDDAWESVELSSPFPFDGFNYTTIWVGTNGDLQLGGLGDDGEIDYDHYSYMEDFVSDGLPSIAINADWNLEEKGTVHFRDFGDRAVFTWNEIGTYQNPQALATFQVQLMSDGMIVLGFNGILDAPGESLIEDLDTGIVVGITAGLEPVGTDPGPMDLSTQFEARSTEIFERWCYDVVDSCGFGGDDLGWPGALNSDFDLDQRNVIFAPLGPLVGDGFSVNPGDLPERIFGDGFEESPVARRTALRPPKRK